MGGTALLGISQPVIKAHGSSNAYAFFNAIRQARQSGSRRTLIGRHRGQRRPTCAWNPGRKRNDVFRQWKLAIDSQPEIVPIVGTASPVKWIPKRSSSI
ncbi:MAG: hypothetical protein ACLSCQ_10350 [Evtepia gabavorous]